MIRKDGVMNLNGDTALLTLLHDYIGSQPIKLGPHFFNAIVPPDRSLRIELIKPLIKEYIQLLPTLFRFFVDRFRIGQKLLFKLSVMVFVVAEFLTVQLGEMGSRGFVIKVDAARFFRRFFFDRYFCRF